MECISSLLDIEYDNFSLVVWDNGSSDSSVRFIEDFLCDRQVPYQKYRECIAAHDNSESLREIITCTETPANSLNNTHRPASMPRIHLVEGAMNHGFAGGCNAGIEFSFRNLQPDYLLLLNNDTIVQEDFLGHLVKAAEGSRDVGILGPTILYYNEDGCSDVIWTRGGVVDFRRYPFFRDLDKPDRLSDMRDNRIVTCDWVSGAALMFPARISVKTLDSSFFFGNEDVDFCVINRKHGWRTCVVPESIIWHKVGVSRRKRYSSKASESFEYLSQNMRLYGKHERHRYLLLPLITIKFVLLTIRTTIQDMKLHLK